MSRDESSGKGFFSLKGFGKSQWLTLALLGLLLVVIAMPAGVGKRESDTAELSASSPDESDQGASAQELRLARLLENMEGVGKAEVMICPENSQESGLFSGDGAGSVGGALIVAEGADDPVTAQKIRRAVQALFQIESHKIEVMKMK